MMCERKTLYDKYKRTNNDNDHSTYKTFRNKVTNKIRQSKKLTNQKLANKLLNNDLRPKDYWKTLKHFINNEQSFSCCIALLFYVHGKHLRSCRDGQLT